MRKTLAWLVHLYTAMGLVCAAGMAVLIVRGGDASFRGAFFLMMVATAIDATDGWLARKARVQGGAARIRRRRARQPDRLSHLHDAAAAADLARRPAAGRPRVAPAAAAARQRATASPRSTSRPTTASSSASRRTGTSSPTICSCCSRRPWVSVALIIDLRGADVRPDAVPLRDPRRPVREDDQHRFGDLVRVARVRAVRARGVPAERWRLSRWPIR